MAKKDDLFPSDDRKYTNDYTIELSDIICLVFIVLFISLPFFLFFKHM